MARPIGDVQKRFETMIVGIPWSGCWLWSGTLNNKGYGMFWTKQTENKCLSHRFAWEQARGAIPKGLCVLHKCDVPCCVNPEHLFLGSIKDNNKDMTLKGRRNSGAVQRARTHCKHGHQFNEANTYWFLRRGRKERQCKQCKNNARIGH